MPATPGVATLIPALRTPTLNTAKADASACELMKITLIMNVLTIAKSDNGGFEK